MPETQWWTDYDNSAARWRHKIESSNGSIEFSIMLRNASKEDLETFIQENLSGIEEPILNIMRENFVVTKRLVDKKSDDPGQLAKFLPGVDNEVVNPATKKKDTLFRTIIELNDTHKWSRDAIADWIESLDEVPVFSVEVESEDGIVVHERKQSV